MNKKTIKLAYGQGYRQVTLAEDNLLGIYNPRQIESEVDETHILKEAMDHPIGTPRLREIAHPGEQIAIVISDISRPCPTDKMLPFIVTELETAGVQDKDVMIVIALGLHRPLTSDEIQRLVSPEMKARFRVVNHDPENTIRLGTTSAGTPVEIFRPVVEADVRICLGNLEFHYYAGYSGGAKAILPGVASRASVMANHIMLVRPEATSARIIGNPVREDLEEAANMLGVDFILNVIVDDEHRILDAVAGDLTAAHRAGCERVARRGMVSIPHQADIVVASTGGYPKDINFYQSHKALKNAQNFVRDGGIIILLAESSEGIGQEIFEQWLLRDETPDETIARLKKEFVFGGHVATSVAMIRKRAEIFLVSELPDEVTRRGGMTPFNNPQDALESAYEKLGEESQVIVLPQAGSVLPQSKYLHMEV